MSTKVYYAYRVRLPYLETFLTKFRDYGRRQIIKHMKQVFGPLTTVATMRAALAKCVQASVRPEKSEACFDLTLNIWLKNDYAYVIPCGNPQLHMRFPMQKGCWSSYVYWNNDDRPSGVTAFEWKTREAVWGEICEDWDHRQVYTVFEGSSKLGMVQISKMVLRSTDWAYQALPHTRTKMRLFDSEIAKRAYHAWAAKLPKRRNVATLRIWLAAYKQALEL